LDGSGVSFSADLGRDAASTRGCSAALRRGSAAAVRFAPFRDKKCKPFHFGILETIWTLVFLD
jgi:transposase